MDRLHAGTVLFRKEAQKTEVKGRRVFVQCEDGSIYGGELLFACDGKCSRVRRQYLPDNLAGLSVGLPVRVILVGDALHPCTDAVSDAVVIAEWVDRWLEDPDRESRIYYPAML